MADIHILGGSATAGGDAARKTVVFHFTIPPQFRETAAANDPELVAFVSAVPNLEIDDPNEVLAIKDGDVVEVVTSVALNFNQTGAERLAIVRAKYAAMENDIVRNYRIRYYEYLNTFAR